MEHSVYLLLLFSGLFTLCSCLSPQYHFVNKHESWTEAQSYCREHHTDLATVDNPEEMKRMMGVVGSDDVHKWAWIGLEEETSSQWQWSLTDRGFYSEGGTEFRNWDKEQPDDGGGNERCAAMQPSGMWNDQPCDSNKRFICYDGRESGTKRYILINEPKAWREAQSYCRENHTDLVSVRNQDENREIKVRNQDENKEIKEKMKPERSKLNLKDQKMKDDWVWIGLYRDAWKWSDQWKSSFRNWQKGEPNYGTEPHSCVVVQLDEPDRGRWNDLGCTNRRPFFCYSDNLILVRENKSWNEALSFCRQQHGDLVSVPTEQVQHWVNRRAQSASTAHVWLGLRFSCAMQFWFWVSVEDMCYENWAPGNKTMECGRTGAVESGAGQQWVSLQETEQLNFICRKCGGI